MSSYAFLSWFSVGIHGGICVLCLSYLTYRYRSLPAGTQQLLRPFFTVSLLLSGVAVLGIVLPIPTESPYVVGRSVILRTLLIVAHLVLVAAADRVADGGGSR